ncbi:MAG: response regulator transcription factor [Flavobacteriales bacterium]|nr:MAG: response regulator transcription factor [Flavobacteriales bacterium]
MKIRESQLKVLALIAEGYTNSEIADKICKSTRTVEAIRYHLIKEAKVRNTAALVYFALKNGILK